MIQRPSVVALAIALGFWTQGAAPASPAVQTPAPAAQATATPAPATTAPSEALLRRLPPDWREVAKAYVRLTEAQQKTAADGTDEAFRQTVARALVLRPEADELLTNQARVEPSPIVRNTIVQLIGANTRWLRRPDTARLLESVVSTDPAATVSITALEALRRWKMRDLNALLNARLAAAKGSASRADIQKLVDEQARWWSLERGTTLPAFLRDAPPAFRVLGADRRVRAVMFGDFGNGSEDQKALAKTIVSQHEKERFNLGLTLGDNFYSTGLARPDDPRWKTEWESLYGPLRIPFYAALGNHDWGGVDSPAAEILYSQRSPSWRLPASYYTFTAGPVQFFAIDSNNIAVSDKQLMWLDAALAASTARWKVVYGHHPIYSGGNYFDSPELIAKLLPLLAHRADAYFCGHDHNLQVLRPEGDVRFFVVGGGGAGLYDLRPSYERSIFAAKSNGFAVVDADTTRLIVSLVDTSGKVVYEETIRKPSAGRAEVYAPTNRFRRRP